MTAQIKSSAALAFAFLSGVVVSAALILGISSARATPLGGIPRGQQVTIQKGNHQPIDL